MTSVDTLVWEFWLFAFWNFQTASWGAYAVTQISEVVPAPKMFMFFALFNCVGKTSGFTGASKHRGTAHAQVPLSPRQSSSELEATATPVIGSCSPWDCWVISSCIL